MLASRVEPLVATSPDIKEKRGLLGEKVRGRKYLIGVTMQGADASIPNGAEWAGGL